MTFIVTREDSQVSSERVLNLFKINRPLALKKLALSRLLHGNS